MDAPEPDRTASQPQDVPGTGLEISMTLLCQKPWMMFGRKPTFLKVPRAQDITAYQEKGAGYRLLRRGSLLGFGIGLGLGLQHRSKRLPKSRSPVPAPSASVNSALSRTRLPVLTPSASISSVQRNTLSSTTRLLPL